MSDLISVRNTSSARVMLAGSYLLPGEVRSGVHRKMFEVARHHGLVIWPPEPAATPLAEQEIKATAEPDDLTRISGIGPKRAEDLAEAGIITFADLAKSNPETLATQIKGLTPEIAAGYAEAARQLAGE